MNMQIIYQPYTSSELSEGQARLKSRVLKRLESSFHDVLFPFQEEESAGAGSPDDGYGSG